MEPGCRALWRRCASHWRFRMSMVLCEPVLSPLVTVRSQHPPLLSYSTMSSPATGITTRLGPGVSRSLCVTSHSRLCWSCQTVVSTSELFCPSCRSLQPPDNTKDFFQILHCDRSFDVNIQELQKKYRNLQRLLHPDYFSQKSQDELDISDQQSSLVNKAYNTLLSPLSRGIYLLGLHGITFAEGTEGGVDTPFLFEVLEVNEQLNEANTDAEIEEIGNLVQEKCQTLTENVKDAFQKDDLEGAKKFLTKMKYYMNILEQVKKKIMP
ncbi:PREDICTED: iron-sulfur cluster co-chaperone protein HscB, mitochondrial [Nanorana parkeri]|uniref:iron-sulfur cluster co-chaperone protein HscB, mitochondrial n=1 Tax=Nanorana parkeri TaxID=125878 RepID=UPI000854BDCB|nr:PREDICTED: iron-sulfur cluster co-chaperone protein HscB, mitochondrial [Nanorana parkeri]